MNANQRQTILKGLRQILQADKLMGAVDVPITPGCFDPKRAKAAIAHAATTAPANPKPQPNQPTQSATQQIPPMTKKPTPSSNDKAARLQALANDHVLTCNKCHLAETRTKVVFGQGNPQADLVFVGEAPGADEDREGVAFIGRAGKLLTKMIEAMGLNRDQDVFICNVLKCRPPDNRTPSSDEIATCSGYLMEQLMIIEPKVIVALGAPAAQTLLNTQDSIGRLRGHFHEYYPTGLPGVGIAVKLMPTYHPAYLLRSPGQKVKVWDDLQMVMAELGLKLPKK